VSELRGLRRKVYSARRDFKDALDVLWHRFRALLSYERQLSLFESDRVVCGPDFDLDSLFDSFNLYLSDLFNNFRVNSCDWDRDSWFVLRSFMDSWGVKETPSFDVKAGFLNNYVIKQRLKG